MAVDPRDARIAELERKLEAQTVLIEALLRRIDELGRENAELRARLNESSLNSSKPPSSDGPQVTRPKSGPTGRRRGGQPGQTGARRQRLSPDNVVDYKPKVCRGCTRELSGEDADPKWFQVFELPEVKPTVTEHRAHSLTCAQCGTVTSESLPSDVLAHGFGPRIEALVAYLSGRCGLSKRQVVELFEEAFDTPMSTGAVCAIEQDVSEVIAAPVEEASEAVRVQPVAHLDETGWRLDKQRAWLWTAVTAVAIVFQVAASRGGVVARMMLGASFKGYVVSDRWSAYNQFDSKKRQLCWAHLIRDIEGMVERGGAGGVFGMALRSCVNQMFIWWAQVKDGTMTRNRLRRLMAPLRKEFEHLLGQAARHAEKKTAGMCAEILKHKEAMWTFVRVDGIEPTNNAAERALRRPVLWRKGSFGNDSKAGAVFTARILTVVATVRLRGGRVLDYLTTACRQYRIEGTAPSLFAINP